MNDHIRIELAQIQDAAGIVKVHYAAVHQTAKLFYSEDVINGWSRPIDNARIEQFQRTVENPDEWLIVAKQNNLVVGFGSIVTKNNELRALYVHPSFGRRGIGAKILTILERQARSLELMYLQMNASINAEAFYRKHGFEVTEYTTHQLGSGQKMACVKMRKLLDGSNV